MNRTRRNARLSVRPVCGRKPLLDSTPGEGSHTALGMGYLLSCTIIMVLTCVSMLAWVPLSFLSLGKCMALGPGVVAHTTHPLAQMLRKEETMNLKSVWTAQQDAVWEIKARGG